MLGASGRIAAQAGAAQDRRGRDGRHRAAARQALDGALSRSRYISSPRRCAKGCARDLPDLPASDPAYAAPGASRSGQCRASGPDRRLDRGRSRLQPFRGARHGLRTGTVAINARYHDGKLDLGSLDRLIPKSGAARPNTARYRRAARSSEGPPGRWLEVRSTLTLRRRRQSAFRFRRQSQGRVAQAGARRLHARRIDGADPVCDERRAGPDQGAAHRPRHRMRRQPIRIVGPRIDADLRTDLALSDINGAFALSAMRAALATDPRRSSPASSRPRGRPTNCGAVHPWRPRASSLGMASTGIVKLGGDYAVRPRPKDQDFSYAATLTAEEIRPASQVAYAKIEASAAGTPLEPLAKKLAAALRGASRANRLTASGRLSGEGRATQLLLNGADFSAARRRSRRHAGGKPPRVEPAQGRLDTRRRDGEQRRWIAGTQARDRQPPRRRPRRYA